MLFTKFRKKRVLKSYLEKLPLLLRKDYGGVGPYTVGQVTNTVERYGLNREYVAYACAIFMVKEHFVVAYQHEPGIAYEDLKQEVADKFFFGNANFSTVDRGYAAFDSGSGFDSD
ncbi:hypothetical protein Misp06_00443 [Microbulbifer sp. NBRC 101763]|uniref:DUF6559 family protein n=1 Tax=Microbulbifer sp. NBRC 101763 TaxID=1113820 RepID=UPI0030A03FAD